jgi:hypothetical protein
MNNFLLSALTEGDIISASNPRPWLFQRDCERVSFGGSA